MAVRVLVVDDDEVSREVLAALLQGEGYEVEVVDSGEAAMLYLKSVRPLPQAVLVDRQMPGISGAELARRMRGVCGAGLALLAMSGSEIERDEIREFDGFLLKPFSMEELAEVLAGTGSAGGRAGAGRGAAVLDEAVYAKLAASMRPAKLQELYAMCVRDAAARVEKMREAALDSDDATWRREAHAIQGGCGLVGALEMQQLARAMEEHGLRGDHVASLDELMQACERLRRILIAQEATDGRSRVVPGEDAR